MPGGFGRRGANRYRRSSIKLCTTTPSTLHDGGGEDGYGNDTMLLNVPYNKLPEQELTFSVLKLDSSLFVQMLNKQLRKFSLPMKILVEEVFSSNEDQEEISCFNLLSICLSITNCQKKQLKSFNASNKRGLSGSNSHEEKEHKFIDNDFEVDGAIKRSQLLNRWFSYPKYHGDLRESGRRSRSSRFGLQSLIERRIRMISLTN